MERVIWHDEPPQLRRPVLVAAFSGWNDASEAASQVVALLRRKLGGVPLAELDTDEFIDFQVTRPEIRFEQDGGREMVWPSYDLSRAFAPGAGRDVLLLSGAEPNLRWRAFADAVVALARRLEVELVVTVGALQVDVPHTRPVPVTGSVSREELRAGVELRPSTYEGPTGITAVLHQTCAAVGLDAVSLWAGVPHYLAAAPYVAAVLALTERVAGVIGAELDLEGLAHDAVAQREEIADLVASDEDLATYVTELEERVDELPDDAEMVARMVSGNELAAELERYLRHRQSDED